MTPASLIVLAFLALTLAFSHAQTVTQKAPTVVVSTSPGSVVSYVFTVTAGPAILATASTITITNYREEDVSAIAVESPQNTVLGCTQTAGTTTCTNFPALNGGTRDVVVKLTVNPAKRLAGTAPLFVAKVPTIGFSTFGTPLAFTQIPKVEVPDIAIAAGLASYTATRGGVETADLAQVTFRVFQVANIAMQNRKIIVNAPAGLKIKTAPNSCVIDGLRATCTITVAAPVIPVDTLLVFDVTADAGTGPTSVSDLTLTAEISCGDPLERECATADAPPTGNNVATTTIKRDTPLVILSGSFATPSSVLLNSMTSLTYRIVNNGLRRSTAGTLTLTPGVGEFQSFTLPAGCTQNPVTGTISCTVGGLAPSGVKEIVITGKATADFSFVDKTIGPTASVVSVPTSNLPATSDVFTSSVPRVKVIAADLQLSASTIAPAPQGSIVNVEFLTTVLNDKAEQVLLEFTIPGNTVVDTAQPDVGGIKCTATGNDVKCTLGQIVVGVTKTVLYKLKIVDSSPTVAIGGSEIRIDAKVSSTPLDSNSANNVATAIIPVKIRDADIQFAITLNPATPTLAADTDVSVRLTNNGPDSAPKVVDGVGTQFSVTLPDGLTIISTTAADLTCTTAAQVVTCIAATDIAPTAQKTLIIKTRALNRLSGYTNKIDAKGGILKAGGATADIAFARDPNQANNVISSTFTMATTTVCTDRCSETRAYRLSGPPNSRPNCGCDADCVTNKDCCIHATAGADKVCQIVYPAVTFSDPANVNQIKGQNPASFKVIPTGGIAPFTYLWREQGKVPAAAGQGATTDTFTPATPANPASLKYEVDVTDAFQTKKTSGVLSYTFNNLPAVNPATTTVITDAAALSLFNTNKEVSFNFPGTGGILYVKNFACNVNGCDTTVSGNIATATTDFVICNALTNNADPKVLQSIGSPNQDGCFPVPTGFSGKFSLPKFIVTPSPNSVAAVYIGTFGAGAVPLASVPVAKREIEAGTGTFTAFTDRRQGPVANNDAAVVAALSSVSVTAGELLGGAAGFAIPENAFIDPDVVAGAGVLTWSLDETPTWVTFNPETRVLSGFPGLIDVGKARVVVRVTDNTAVAPLSATREFFITVAPPKDLLSQTSVTLKANEEWSSEYLFLTNSFQVVKVTISPSAGSVYNMLCLGDYEGSVVGNIIDAEFSTTCRKLDRGGFNLKKRDDENVEGGFRIVVTAGPAGATFALSVQRISPVTNIVNLNLRFANLGKFVDH